MYSLFETFESLEKDTFIYTLYIFHKLLHVQVQVFFLYQTHEYIFC